RSVIQIDLEVGDQISLAERAKVARGSNRSMERGNRSQKSARLIIKKINGLEWNLNLASFIIADQDRTRGDDGIPGTVSAAGLDLGGPDVRKTPTQKQSHDQESHVGDAGTRQHDDPPNPFVSPGIAVEQGIADRDRHCATDRRTRPDQPRAPAFARAKRNGGSVVRQRIALQPGASGTWSALPWVRPGT